MVVVVVGNGSCDGDGFSNSTGYLGTGNGYN